MFITLDSIIHNILLNKRRPMHWYLEYLNHGKDCLRELNFDVMKTVDPQILKLNSYKAAVIPGCWADVVMVGRPIGQYVQPLLQYNKISRLNNFDNAGDKILYGVNRDESIIKRNVTMCIDNDGRQYGRGTGRETDTYKIVKERNEIQMDEHFEGDEIYAEGIGDGSSCSAATQVDPLAQNTIEKYILWQEVEHNRNSGLGDKREGERKYTVARDGLLARNSDITIEDVKRVYRRAYYGAIKN